MDTVNLKFRITKRQRDALHREAKRRGKTASALIREQIAAVTGVDDPLAQKAYPGTGKRAKKT